MNKRILSMLLALCMVLVALPVFALAVVAADSEEATVNISFCLPDGTEVCTRKVTPGVANFELPTNEEIEAAVKVYNAKDGIKDKYELTKDDVLGFYDVSFRNAITAAEAYSGTLINKDITFYAFTTKSVFKPGNNWPRYTDKTSFDGYRGGWSVGYYNKDSKAITAYTSFDAANNILNAGDTWTQGGLYVAADPHMVTCANNSAVLAWKAIAPGTIDIGMDFLGFTSLNATVGGTTVPDFAMAIAKNGKIIWPKADTDNKDKTIADTWAAAGSGENNTWYYATAGKTFDEMKAERKENDKAVWDISQNWKTYCETNGTPTITVDAGDEIQIVFKRVSFAILSCYPTVTYTTSVSSTSVEAAKAGITTDFSPVVYQTGFSASENYPTYSGAVVNGDTVTFHGNWDIVRYDKTTWGDTTRAVANKFSNITTAGNVGDSFITATGTGAWGTATGMRVVGGNTAWGGAGALSSTVDYTVGYRYTAEHTGLANIVFTDYYINADQTPKDAVLGVFVNGQMVWPEQGDYYGDMSKWATVTTTKKTAENLPTGLRIAKGDMIEVLIGAPNGYVRGATVAPVSVAYTQVDYKGGPEIAVDGALNANGNYDISLTIDPGVTDIVKVEVADNRGGAYGTYTELTASNGKYTAADCAKEMYDAYFLTFRVTLSKGGEEMTAPQYISYMMPARYAPLIHTGFGLNKNAPSVANGKATFQGGWDFVLYSAVSEIGTSAGRIASYYYSTQGSAVFSDSNKYEYGSADLKAAINYAGHADWGGLTYGAYVRNGSAVSYRYIAEGSGLVDITLDKLGHTTSTWASDVSWGIFVNGEKIWPTANTAIEGLTFVDGWLRHTTKTGDNLLTADQLAAINAQLKNVYLRKGDALEFVCYAHGSDVGRWSNTGNVCYASVDYTAWEEAELPTVDTVSAVMGTDFGFVLNCTKENPQVAELLATATIGDSGRDLSVTVDGNAIRITGIRATEMTDTITYRVYARSTNGTVAVSHLVKEGTTTYADILANYLVEGTDVKAKDMAIATLKYGAAAQTRFLYRTDDLATRVLGEGDVFSEGFTVPTAANEYAQTSAATNYRFAGASFLLNEKIQLKLFIDLQAGQEMLNETLYLEIAEGNGEFERSDAKIAQRKLADPSDAHLKAILDLKPTANATVYRFRLVNEAGDVVSTELTYSVATYAYSAVEDKALTDAILAFGQAARNYNNV